MGKWWMLWRESLDAVSVLILSNSSKQCRWHDDVQRIFHRADEERKDNSENENRVCWAKNFTWSLCDVNGRAAALQVLPYRAVVPNSLCSMSPIHPAALSVITRRKHLTHYENLGSGKKASVMIQPGFSWWRFHTRAGRAFAFWISPFSLGLFCDGKCFA